MSASSEKKIRAQAKAEGNDKRAIAEAEEAKKKQKTRTITVVVIIAVVIFSATVLFLNSTFMYKNTTALTVNKDRDYSPAEVNYEYASQYYNIVNTYGNYTSMIGLDTTYGLAGLVNQECNLTEEGGTWREFLLDGAKSNLKQYYALTKYANENGITLSEDEKKSIEDEIASLETSAASYGYASGDKFLAANYGKGVDTDVLRSRLEESTLASKAYQHYSDSVEVTDAEVKAEYPSVAVRHILIKAVADENGEYSDAAVAEAKTKAEALLDEWKKGAATEESFAELAKANSEDEGSKENGGLYENVMQGTTVEEFDAFCFDSARKPGDTAVVYGDNGGYKGYHVMYFVGEGDPATNETGRSYIQSEKVSAWLDNLTAPIEVEEGFWIRLVGKS